MPVLDVCGMVGKFAGIQVSYTQGSLELWSGIWSSHNLNEKYCDEWFGP